MQVATTKGKDKNGKQITINIPDPTPKSDHPEPILNKVPKNSNPQDVAGGDYSVPVPKGLDPVFANPEFSKAADALIEAIRHQFVTVQAEEMDGKKILETANKILESRV